MMLRSFSVRRFLRCSKFNFSIVTTSTAGIKLSSEEKKIGEPDESSTVDQRKLVAAAFASLNNLSDKSEGKSSFTKEIIAAQDLHSLLSLAEKTFLTRQQAMKILSVLASWANEGRVKLSDFESDVRFAKLCRILGKNRLGEENPDAADLSVVLGVTADEQAAKLISSISLSQMIKILKSLSMRKRRSTPLLRSLAFHIAGAPDRLDVKEVSDVFYAITELNYPDEVLLEKICDDLRECLVDTQNPAVVVSVIRSLGILKYRDSELLNQLIEWVLKKSASLTSKDFFTLLFTLGSVNYKPEIFPRFYQVLKPYLNKNTMVNLDKWVLAVWSLVTIQHYDESIIDSVIQPDFIGQLMATRGSKANIDVLTQVRLLQINGVAKQLGDAYKGNLLDETSDMFQIQLTERKDKQSMIDSVKDTVSSVISSPNEFLQVQVNSNMGFLIDIVCCVDKKSNFIKLDSNLPKEDMKKIALMVCDYHDFCRGCYGELAGYTVMKHRLLTGMGYHVVPIPFMEYSLNDVLMNRVRYVLEKIKEINS